MGEVISQLMIATVGMIYCVMSFVIVSALFRSIVVDRIYFHTSAKTARACQLFALLQEH